MAKISENTQRVLDKIAPIANRRNFYLAGETACAIHLAHRISLDLDFFSEKEFSSDIIRNELENSFKLDNVSMDIGTLNLEIDGVKTSFLWYPYPLLEKYSEYDSINLASLLDIALMKLSAIGSRGSRRDFIDVYYIVKEHYSIYELFQALPQKFGDLNISHILRSLVFFDDAEKEPQIHTDTDWDEIKQYFISETKKLLQKYIGGQ